MFKRSLIILIISSLFVITCKENVTENEPLPTLRNVKILHPSGGEKLLGLEQDTIRWSHPETIESMGIYYTLDDGKKWITILHDEQIKSGYYLWSIPNVETTEAKIKLLIAAGTESYEVTSDSCFSIEKRDVKIIDPTGFEVYNVPGKINIKWESNFEVENFELYYSKFGKDIIDESWILIDKNIDLNASEYVWTLPSMYSNQVFLKIVGIYPDSAKIVAISDTNFAVYDDNVLEEEREYREKYELGNKWVYHVTEDRVWDNDLEYYLVKKVVDTKVENGINYYEVQEKIIKDSINTNYSWVAGRENYSPAFVMQNESYTEQNWRYYYASCYYYNEIVFSNQQKVKEYYCEVSESGTANSRTRRIKDIGMIYYRYYSEGHLLQKDLVGAFIDDVVYGDTTIVQ